MSGLLARTSDQINPRRVPSFAQAHKLLVAVRGDGDEGRHLYGFFSCLYFGGLRPSEARDLKRADCHLPAHGWGSLILAGSAPEICPGWTDDGQRFTSRELKHRAEGEVRIVPIPPDLVTILREHLKTHGTAPDGRLFWEVARRLGHSVATLYTTYASWLNGQEEHANKLIDAAYTTHKAEINNTPDHGPITGQAA